MIGADYWDLVEADPRDLTRDQKILFWWVVGLLRSVSSDGAIVGPGQAPLNDDQIREVYEAILPEEGTERSYLDKIWSYSGQKVIFPSNEGHLVMISSGEIVIEEDKEADFREKL